MIYKFWCYYISNSIARTLVIKPEIYKNRRFRRGPAKTPPPLEREKERTGRKKVTITKRELLFFFTFTAVVKIFKIEAYVFAFTSTPQIPNFQELPGDFTPQGHPSQ